MTSVSSWWLGLSSELVGTAILMILGNAVCSAVSFKGMYANRSGRWILIAFGWGLAVFCSATVSIAMQGNGILNPAILIMQAIMASDAPSGMFSNGINVIGSINGGVAATFFIALIFEFIGAMLGQLILNFINFKFIKDKENSLVTIRGAHCTTAYYKNKEDKATIFNFSYELVATLVLAGMLLAFDNIKSFSSITPILAMLVITSIGISLGSATGFSLNPARDLSPRIIFAILVNTVRKEDKVQGIVEWNYSWIPVVAPIVAGTIIGCFGLI